MVQQSSGVSEYGQISESAAVFRKSRKHGRRQIERGRRTLPVAHGLYLPLFSLAAETRQPQVGRATGVLWMAFNFEAKAGRFAGECDVTLRLVHDFDGVHRLRLHPTDAPSARMSRGFLSRAVRYATVSAMITNMRSPAAGVPIQKETRPTVMMHRNGSARRRYGDFEHAHEFIFENNFVGIGRGLHGVVAVGELRFILCVGVEM